MRKWNNLCTYALFAASFFIAACENDDELGRGAASGTQTGQTAPVAIISDGLYQSWNAGDVINLLSNTSSVQAQTQAAGAQTILLPVSGEELTSGEPLYGVYPAKSRAAIEEEALTLTFPSEQTVGETGFDSTAYVIVARQRGDTLNFHGICGGLKLNLQLQGVTKIELESVDGYALAGKAKLSWDEQNAPRVASVEDSTSILTFTFEKWTAGRDYYLAALPCNVYGGYRISIYKDDYKDDYFGVHQTFERATFITPTDLQEADLEFTDPDAPLVEEERPELDATTTALLREYQRNPTEENKQALLEQMGLRYDKVVARKKAKLRELERDAKTQGAIDEMQNIVDEMVENREIRLEQQFLRLIDPRNDDNPSDEWLVLRGASASNPYICYAPVTNTEYAQYNTAHRYTAGQENYPVVGMTIAEATAYCDWLMSKDALHLYRLPSDEEWTLAAGHMPKDVAMNAGGVEDGLTAVDAYAQTTGACGGIDFWGNCWEWTSTTDAAGLYIVKGGSWDADRDDCRTEKSDVVRQGTQGYANVGFRVVRTDRDSSK